MLPNLTYVSLKGNSYSKVFFQQFYDILKDSKKLEKVDYSDVFVGRKKDEVPESIRLLSSSFM